jgi:tetraacyldisaccharide 4'-kinase
MVQYLARLLKEHGYKPAVISRGYGGSTREPVNVVSDGSRVLLPAKLVGDEPRLLAETLTGVPVLTGVVRHLPAMRAVGMGADILLLDDGFQHMAVARDLDLVLFSADHLAGNSRIFPGGDLREPVSALRRCSCFILTGINEDNKERGKRFAALLRERFPGKKLYITGCRQIAYVYRDENDGFIELHGKPVELDKSIALCGIARPESFRKTLAECDITPVDFLIMDDHHAYKEADLVRIARKVDKSGAHAVITTEKDMVKLGGAVFKVPIYGVRLEMQPEDSFDTMILKTLRQYSGEKDSG